MGQVLSNLTDCGLLHIIVGDPDYEVVDGEIQHSAARRSRERSIVERRVADGLAAREAQCHALEQQLENYQNEALRCRTLLMTPSTTPLIRSQALARAHRLVKTCKETNAKILREQALIRQGRVVLDRANSAQSGATDTDYLSDVSQLASHINTSVREADRLENIGDKLLDQHSDHADFDASLNAMLGRLDQAANADDNTELSALAVNENEVMAALNGMFEQQEFVQAVAPAALPKTSSGLTDSQYTTVDLTLPSVPPGSLPRTYRSAEALTTSGRSHAQTRRSDFGDIYK